jgi:hypothetical protein
MKLEKKECENAAYVLQETKKALEEKDPIKLRELSNRTTHSSCFYQDPGSITTAVLIYALSKLIERKDYKKIKSWTILTKKLFSIFDLAIQALKNNNSILYAKYMQQARKTLESASINLKPYIQNVLRKSSINKANKMHEHGISMEQTASLLGITRWELAEYIGQNRNHDIQLDKTISTKKRAEMALRFFK